jgi:uncharacterized protein YyaL (SSP411 family)
MWIYVNAATPTMRDGRYPVEAYGHIGMAMMALAEKTGEKRFRKWAAQKLEFAWKTTLSPTLPMVVTELVPTGIAPGEENENTSDTDSLYFIRRLFEVYRITKEKRYRDWALATTDLWYRSAWVPEWKQFVRKLLPNGKPARPWIYGDAKYNLPRVLIEAYRITRDEKYIRRFSTTWNNFLAQGEGGLVPSRMDSGKMVKARGADPQQSIFIDILLKAYEATEDKKWLLETQRFAGVVLGADRRYWRMNDCQAGMAFLRVGLALRDARIG